MATPSVFVGLVSHTESHFYENQGPAGLTARLVGTFEEVGFDCTSQINTRNFFNEAEFPLTPKMARESVRAEIKLESKWFRFLEGKNHCRNSSRIFSRKLQFLLSWRQNSGTSELRRLLNIEYSHIDLYRAAIASGSDWSVILEDDAFATDPGQVALSLQSFFKLENAPKFINLSESFSLEELGIWHLFTESPHHYWAGTPARVVYQSERPATNTVCAIAFRTDFLKQIVADFDSQPTQPVLPIDWKLNATLMRLFENGEVRVNECLFVEPAPVVQLSMVRDREAN
ncbi:hypothetical protein N9R12_01030 [Actinomycetota bacterium]|nr:hypothetical protein [Actinomycetota bacterium]